MDGVLRSETEQNVVAYCVLYDVHVFPLFAESELLLQKKDPVLFFRLGRGAEGIKG